MAGLTDPANKAYIQQRYVHGSQCKATELSNMHALRHRYAQLRYEALTEWKALAAVGPDKILLNANRQISDQHAR